MRTCLAIALTIAALAACAATEGEVGVLPARPPALPDTVWREPFETPAQLDRAALGTFVIVSDHKGRSPNDTDQMRRFVAWSDEMHAQFVVGLGDHLKRGFTNLIFRFMDENPAWRDRFYPNIADGENEYYGRGQSDWGAGGKLFDDVGMYSRPNVSTRPNGCGYYARLPLADRTVHLIQLHFPDSPKQPDIAFNESTRAYLDSLLEAIPHEPREIIVVGAHSRSGNWVDVLELERRERVLDRVTLALSATTHRFQHFDYGPKKALCINTGSPYYTQDVKGFVSVHLLGDPARLILQYVDVGTQERAFAPPERAFVRVLDTGETSPVVFGKGETIAR